MSAVTTTVTTTIPLGSADRLTVLFSYPNFAGDPRTLAQTIEHWFGLTLERDAVPGASAQVRVSGSDYALELSGPDSAAAAFALYAQRLPQFMANGWAAWSEVVPQLKAQGRWDPCPNQPLSAYLPWRFFLPWGMPMLNQRALLFFHYPPIRLLETNQDYLDDPVPVRCEELLSANGVLKSELMLFNTVMDAAPIGAEDNQGSKNPQQCAADGCPASAYDKEYGLIPIQFFAAYQKAQVSLLLNASPTPGYSAPIVVYGAHPLAVFNQLYGCNLRTYQSTVLTSVVPGLKTPVLASTHPYVFYGKAQGFDQIGSGVFTDPNKNAAAQMKLDLAVARWLKRMAADPTQPTDAVWQDCKTYWNDPAQQAAVDALVQHQGSLWYYDPPSLAFKFKVPLPAPAQADQPKSAAASATPSARASHPAPAKGLRVLGDSGEPVDWWFIYKISKESKSSASPPQPATGQEYLYYDAEMAKAGKPPVLSTHKIDQSGALFDTYSQLFGAEAKDMPKLGWYAYNDEDRYEPGTQRGTGPSPCGHCKGALAFDLESDSAFWLIHSVPLLPMTAAFDYPATGFKMAQTLLCIQLRDAAAAKPIAQLMFDAHGPNVNVASDLLTSANDPANNFAHPPLTQLPAALGYQAGQALQQDPRLNLMQNRNGSEGSHPEPYAGQLPFVSKGGQSFLAIAKNRAWGNPEFKQPAKDFYNLLVSTALNQDIDVETWENAGPKIPPEQEQGSTHKVENMRSVNLAPLCIPWSWSEANDHAKLAISDRGNPAGSKRWVCVGDINFTDSMEKRGGGTVAFVCEPLWRALSQVLSAQPEGK